MKQTLVNSNSMADQAYAILREQIIIGEYHPGDKVSEQVVADRLGISRSPVREAIHRLANEGLVDFFPRRGAFIKIYTSKMIHDSFQTRLLLEQYAIANIKKELVEEKRDELLDLRAELHNPPREGYTSLDGRIHDTITSLCGNASLLNIYRLLYTQISTFRMIVLIDQDHFEKVNDCHVKLIDAILNMDIELAKQLIADHLDDSEQAVKHYYEEYEANMKA